jgi:hypothetical protein
VARDDTAARTRFRSRVIWSRYASDSILATQLVRPNLVNPPITAELRTPADVQEC